MSDLLQLNGRVAIVTGAGNGIGLAIARALSEHGATVYLADIHEEGCRAEAVRIANDGGKGIAIRLDVRDDREVRERISEVLQAEGRLDILVNSAGIIPQATVDAITAEDWDEVMAVNARGILFTSRFAMGPMAEMGSGVIINIASNAGKTGSVLAGMHYAASKAAVISLTMSFARLLASKNIRVVGLSPGPVKTRANEHIDCREEERLRSNVPLGRIAEAREIANAAVFLASDAASYITGEVLDVDGGITFD